MAEILFVDDEDLLRDVARRFFTMEGFAIDTAGHYQQAVDYLDSKEYDIVLLDINMPGKYNGIDLMHEIRRRSRETRIIMITGNPTLATATDAVRYGAYDYLLKPFDLQSIKSVVASALEEKQHADKFRQQHLALEKYQGVLEKTLVEQIHEIRRANDVAEKALITSLHMLAKAAEYHDEATNLHIERVAAFSQILAKNSGLSPEQQHIIFHAAPMHDVGKVGIPYQILIKPASLSEGEFLLIKEHCRIGHDILKGENHPIHQAAAHIALTHHERWDGKGYPQGIGGEDIPLYGRIVGIADVFDALVSERVYKTAWPAVDAMRHIQTQSGAQFDPELVSVFCDSLEELEIARQKILEDEAEKNQHNYVNTLKEKLYRFHRAE